MTALAFESFHLGLRTMRRWMRVPANWISVIFFPLIQLLIFSQLFQQITDLPAFGPAGSYLAYLAPGQVVFAAFFAVSWAGYGLIMEYRSGYLDKLRALPIQRWSILLGEMAPLIFQAAGMAGVLLVISLLLGARIETGIGGFLLILLLSGIFGLSWAGISFVPALVTRSEQATGTLSLLFFPVVFMSTAFVPESMMPGWMQVVNDWNPITFMIEAIRSLMTSGYDWDVIGTALLSTAIVGVVTQTATIWSFRRLAN